MDVRKLALLFGALMIAAVTAVMAKNMFTGASAPKAVAAPVVPAGPEVLVATRPLPVGTIIDAEAFRFQRWPEGLVQDQYYVRGRPNADPSTLIGTVVRNAIGQVVGFMSLENGLILAAVGVQGMPLIVEMLVAFAVMSLAAAAMILWAVRRLTRPVGDPLVLQPGFTAASGAFAPVTFSRPLLMASAPHRPVLHGFNRRRALPDQMPEQAAHLRHGKRQQPRGVLCEGLSPRWRAGARW